MGSSSSLGFHGLRPRPEQPLADLGDSTADAPERFRAASRRTGLANVVSVVLASATSIIAARSLGPARNGELAIALVIAAFAISGGSLGLGSSITYLGASGSYSFATLRSLSRRLSVVLGGLATAVGAAVILLLEYEPAEGSGMGSALVALLGVAPGLYLLLSQGLALGFHEYRAFSISQVAESVLRLVGTVVLVVVLPHGVTGALAAWMLGSAVGGAIAEFLPARRRGTAPADPAVLSVAVRDALAYGVKLHAANLVTLLLYRLDVLLVGLLADASAAGVYAVAVGLAERLWLPSQVASTILLPRTAAEPDDQARDELTVAVSRVVFTITIALSVVVALVAEVVVVLLYSETYEAAAGALQALLPGVVLLGQARILASDIAGRGRPLLNLGATVTTLVVNVVLNLVLIPRHGVQGAAWAASIAYATTFAILGLMFLRVSRGVRLRELLIPQRSDARLLRDLLRGS